MARAASPARPIEVSLAALLHALFAALLLALAVQSLLDGGSVAWALGTVVAGLFWAAVAAGLWCLDPVARNTVLVPACLIGILAAGHLITHPLPLNGTRIGFLLFSLACIACLSTPQAREAFRNSRAAS